LNDSQTSSVFRRLPAVRLDAQGRRRVDLRAVLALAWPLFLNSSVQAVLNLTDTWFVGRLSVEAVAAVGGVFFLTLVFVIFIGGIGNAVQTLVAQAFGGGRRVRAALAAWSGLYGAVITSPLYVLIAYWGDYIISPFGFAPEVHKLAVEYWFPRLIGGWVIFAIWGLSGFFNGIGRPAIPLTAAGAIGLLNAGLCALFLFGFGWGVAGVGWATSLAQFIGLLGLLSAFLSSSFRREYRTALVWRPRPRSILRLFRLGIPMGAASTADLVGFALFQLMLTRLGAVEGAASQVVMMLTSACYMPGIGLAIAGTTLVGQSIGAGDRDWAARCGNTVIILCMLYMGLGGLALALAGQPLVSLFVTGPEARAAVSLGGRLLWIAAGYQVFDALNLGCNFCLRGAGDVRFPAAMLLLLSWFGFVPLTHALTYGPGQGLVDFLPQYGLGAAGSWVAALIYIIILGLCLLARWRSGRWRRIQLR
jgi:MATE family multidrug resistance protein